MIHKVCCEKCYSAGMTRVLDGLIARTSKKRGTANRIRVALYQHPRGMHLEDIIKASGKGEHITLTRLYELRRKGEVEHNKDFWWFV